MEIEKKNGREEKHNDPMLQLEETLDVCQFGRFGIRLMLACFSASLSSNSVVTSTSFVMPNAECDLKMTIMQKGIMNATPFIGQIVLAFFTGFVTDAFGRRPFLIAGHLGLFVCCLIEGSSQNYWMMFAVKLMEGLMICFSFNTTPALLSELVHRRVRDRVMILYATSMALSSVVSALMAWAVLPRMMDVVLWDGYFELHSWNFYLYACSIWSGLAAIMFYFLPESPKYLLTHGRRDEAWQVLDSIYKENHGKNETLPIKSFSESLDASYTKKKSIKAQIVECLANSKDLFRKPIVNSLLLIAAMVFVSLSTVSALRLWFPQISTIVENYKKDNGDSARFCVMINDYTKHISETRDVASNVTAVECIPKTSGSETYRNSMILGVVSLTSMSINVILINYIPQKPIMFGLCCLCAAFSAVLYWTDSSLAIAMMISGVVGFMQAMYSLFNAMFVRVFPTRVRTMALSLILSVGRIGSLSGSILFPVLLEAGCMIPFGALAVGAMFVSILIFFLPKTETTEKSGR